MNTRTRTIASFFSIAMAAMLLGAVVTTQVRTQTALARPAETDPAAAQPAARPPSGPVTLDTFRDIARLQTPGVVNISTKKLVRRRTSDPFREFFGDDLMERFFGPQTPQRRGDDRSERHTQRSLGSGFIIDREGYILTNRHVIEGADQISVTLNSGKEYEARLVGKDARTDVALLKIEPKDNLIFLNLGNSDQIEVGEWVMAIGNPFALWQSGTAGGPSVTVGVISYKGRGMSLTRKTSVDMIQTDAAINPGNSGGPLLNTRGEVVGLNTLIVTGGLQQSAGVGFSVPINVAKEILPQLRDKGRVVRGWMGVQIQPITEDLAQTYRMPEAKGAVISDVTDNSPADKAGLEPGDVVVEVDGRQIEDNNDLSRYIASRAPGTTVRLKVLRNGSDKSMSLTLGTFPEETADAEDEEEGGVQLGMTLRELTPDLAARLEMPRTAKGVVIMDVEAGSAAEDAGLQQRDVIVSVNGQTVEDPDDFKEEIEKARADGVARLRVRNGNTHRFTVLRLR